MLEQAVTLRHLLAARGHSRSDAPPVGDPVETTPDGSRLLSVLRSELVRAGPRPHPAVD
jgi:hypothetical protein